MTCNNCNKGNCNGRCGDECFTPNPADTLILDVKSLPEACCADMDKIYRDRTNSLWILDDTYTNWEMLRGPRANDQKVIIDVSSLPEVTTANQNAFYRVKGASTLYVLNQGSTAFDKYDKTVAK